MKKRPLIYIAIALILIVVSALIWFWHTYFRTFQTRLAFSNGTILELPSVQRSDDWVRICHEPFPIYLINPQGKIHVSFESERIIVNEELYCLMMNNYVDLLRSEHELGSVTQLMCYGRLADERTHRFLEKMTNLKVVVVYSPMPGDIEALKRKCPGIKVLDLNCEYWQCEAKLSGFKELDFLAIRGQHWDTSFDQNSELIADVSTFCVPKAVEQEIPTDLRGKLVYIEPIQNPIKIPYTEHFWTPYSELTSELTCECVDLMARVVGDTEEYNFRNKLLEVLKKAPVQDSVRTVDIYGEITSEIAGYMSSVFPNMTTCFFKDIQSEGVVNQLLSSSNVATISVPFASIPKEIADEDFSRLRIRLQSVVDISELSEIERNAITGVYVENMTDSILNTLPRLESITAVIKKDSAYTSIPSLTLNQLTVKLDYGIRGFGAIESVSFDIRNRMNTAMEEVLKIPAFEVEYRGDMPVRNSAMVTVSSESSPVVPPDWLENARQIFMDCRPVSTLVNIAGDATHSMHIEAEVCNDADLGNLRHNPSGKNSVIYRKKACWKHGVMPCCYVPYGSWSLRNTEDRGFFAEYFESEHQGPHVTAFRF